MGILAWLRGKNEQSAQQTDGPQIEAIAERILGLSPQLRLLPQYRARISPVIATAFEHVSGLVASLPPARDANAAAWAADPYIHAFFATPDEVAQIISRSSALHAFFESHLGADLAYAVLGMAMTQSSVLGVEQSGDRVRTDVRRTTVCFTDHQVRVCAGSDELLRQEVVPRVMDQLVMEGLAKATEDQSRRDTLEEERALLKARLQLHERQGTGMRGVLGHDVAVDYAEIASLHEQLKENERKLGTLGLKTESLERTLDQLCEVLASPAAHLMLSSVKFRLSRLNLVVESGSNEVAEELDLRVGGLRSEPSQQRAFVIIRFARADLQARRTLDDAARMLI
jgi:hypothetical protein